MTSVTEVDVAHKSVLVRADLEFVESDSPRSVATIKIIEYLKQQGAFKIKVIGHKGHFSFEGVEVVNDLRSDPREEENSAEFAQELAQGFDVYVNESFATSHRKHTSIVALPELMKSQGKEVCVGERFEMEIQVLNKILNNTLSDPPLNLRGGRDGGDIKKVLVVGGAKGEDKEKCAEDFEKQGWTVLRGGLLPGAILRTDGFDISNEEIKRLSDEVAKAETIVLAGPMGKYEEAPEGTKEVFKAVANSKAYKIAGGGDTEAALGKFGLLGKFDWISVGGGAMLEFLATGTLVGIEALMI